jgi:hypothetical protein
MATVYSCIASRGSIRKIMKNNQQRRMILEDSRGIREACHHVPWPSQKRQLSTNKLRGRG